MLLVLEHSRLDGQEELLMGGYHGVQTLRLIHVLDQLIPRTLENFEQKVILRLSDEMHHLGGQLITLAQHRSQF